MTKLLIIEPMDFQATASRGSGAANLTSRDPKEVWADSAAGSAAAITIDLGQARSIDTIFLGYVRPPVATATWTITGGLSEGAEFVIQPQAILRVPDVSGRFATISHALWNGLAVTARYLTITVNQPAGTPLTIGVAVVGLAFVAALGQEWGAGRQPIDTGSATSLPSGGFSVVDGVRKRRFGWTFGDLSLTEADQLEQIALDLGETKPALVIENAASLPGLRSRIFYGLFEKWKVYERRNRQQTRWDIGIEEWV
ncbi:hypothetical protein [Sphingomonas sp. CROZ-RG-20F-R02-07]|uniref:hypothetical protein n=1 Tax=Sphingomonas sp. CROZ-RG-20F-R02-07 TaxID=2914832 RepID=UPI001F571177|nr:hypothetical protein [Sphingomonas sp. CROZ-RG-20F-R02-07]